MRSLMVFCFLLWGTAALAGGLSQDEAERFVDSLPEAVTVGEQVQQSEKAAEFSMIMSPSPGQPYAPYARGISWMRTAMPDLYMTSAKIAEKHGFDSAEEWAAVGDRVMAAFMAIEVENMPEGSRRMAEQMTPEMLQAMPANVRAQIEGAMAMLAMTKTVSPEDLELVRKLVPRMREQLGG